MVVLREGDTMRRAILIIALATSSPALAGHRHCEETSSVVGYQQCSRFGAMWGGATLAWELGVTAQRFRFDAIDHDVGVTGYGTVHLPSPAPTGASTANSPLAVTQ